MARPLSAENVDERRPHAAARLTDRRSDITTGTPRIRSNSASTAPPPWEVAVAAGGAEAVLMTTDVLAVAAGGAPAQVMEYVTVPTLVSVTVIDPEVESVPVQPSPGLPPEATQESAFEEFHVSDMAEPADCVASLLDKVTPGVVTFGDDGGSAV